MDPNTPDERRPSMAPFLLVSLLVIVGWTWLRAKYAPPPAPAPVAAPTPAAGVEGGSPASAPGAALPAVTDVPRDDQILVDTRSLRARFSNRGAVLVELLLKRHFRTAAIARDDAKHDDPASWLPLLAPIDPEGGAFALRRNGADAGAIALERSNWAVERKPSPEGEELAFRLTDGSGRRFEKLFRFRPDGYLFDVELRFASDRAEPTQGTSSYAFTAVDGIWSEHASRFTHGAGAVVTAEDPGELQVVEATALADGPQPRGFARKELAPFFGARNDYFGLALSPDAATAALVDNVTCSRLLDPFAFDRAKAKKVEGRAPLTADEEKALRDESITNVRVESFLKVATPSAGAAPLSLRFRTFAGPRAPEEMTAPELEPFRLLYEVEYGGRQSLRFINRALLWWMRLMAGLTGNWGVAIILLTITVKLLLFPLNRLQSRTMEQFQKKMKALQPELDELKKKYKGNLQKLSEAQRKLQAEHNVRPPIFGCLILFLQMPVWYGLFQIMSTAPSLRHQPFFGWIHDLSAPDVVPLPFSIPIAGELHLLPILMVVAWLVQNRMMPKPVDPQQAQMQKMMNFFPLIFGLMLYGYAAGQSLYMVTNSLLGMAQMKLLKVTPTN